MIYDSRKILSLLIIHLFINSFIHPFILLSVLQQVQSSFQSEFSREYDLMLPVSFYSNLSFPWVHPVSSYIFFLVFSSFRSFFSFLSILEYETTDTQVCENVGFIHIKF